jgi:uncharacterized protein (TIGR02246 family)
MKKVFLILTLVCIGFASCQRNESAPAVNKEEASKAVGELFDGFNSAFKIKDASAMGNFLSDDGIFLGTDPEEFWSKQSVMEDVSKMAQDTTIDTKYTVDKREVRVSPDGKTALVIEQSVVPFLGKIPVRTIGHAAMKDGQWKIDFYSWNLVPKNESLDKLSQAYQ